MFYLFVIFLVLPKVLYSYIDPGILTFIFQYFYTLFAGLVLIFIVTPYIAVKNIFQKIKQRILSLINR